MSAVTCIRPDGQAKYQGWCLRCGGLVVPGGWVSFWRGQDAKWKPVHASCTPPVKANDRRCARCWTPIRQRFEWRDGGKRQVPVGPAVCVQCGGEA